MIPPEGVKILTLAKLNSQNNYPNNLQENNEVPLTN